MANAAWLWIRPEWDQDSRICAADRAPGPGSAAARPGGHVLDDGGDLLLELRGDAGEGGDPLAEPDEGLVQDAGLPAGAGRAGQRGAFFGPPLSREGAEPFAQWCGGGDQDRRQRGAGGPGGLDGVVPVDHQQPQRLTVPIGAHLGRVRARQQLAGRPDCVDRVALARPAFAGVPAAVDPGYLLTLAGQMPGQAQPITPGPFHRPEDLAAPGS
jgi:hypothetical protein